MVGPKPFLLVYHFAFSLFLRLSVATIMTASPCMISKSRLCASINQYNPLNASVATFELCQARIWYLTEISAGMYYSLVGWLVDIVGGVNCIHIDFKHRP